MASRSRILPLLFLFAMALGLGTPAFSQAGNPEQAALQETPGELLEEAAAIPAADQELSAFEKFDAFWGANVNTPIANAFFWDVWFWDNDTPVLDEAGNPMLGPDGEPLTQSPITILLAVVWLVVGSVILTIKMGFINVRAFGHAIQVVMGKWSNPEDKGEVSHFQALTAALSATVGLGNIAGVAIAVSTGGPGATFWMIVAGLIGMSAKFTECTLGQMYRQVRPDGSVMGGAMYYMSLGLSEVGRPKLGKVIATIFAVMCVMASFAGGNAFQVNQSLGAIGETVPWLAENGWAYGLVMSVLVGIVIIGGIKRIASTAEKIVPAMCALFVGACLFILFRHAKEIPGAFGEIIGGAFSFEAGFGGFIGVLVVGFQRAAFSNEAGAGSAAIAHSAARTPHPAREGIVALLEPFIDTVVVCTMTALVIVITGAWNNPEYAQLVTDNQGASLTSRAMDAELSGFKYLLSLAVLLFAFSTMISWSYYGERCWVYLFGDKSSMIFKVIFVVFVFIGSILTATNVLAFGDLMILGLAFPNIFGIYFLIGKVKASLNDYLAKIKSGELKRYK